MAFLLTAWEMILVVAAGGRGCFLNLKRYLLIFFPVGWVVEPKFALQTLTLLLYVFHFLITNIVWNENRQF